MKKQKVSVFKIGGSIMDDPEILLEFLHSLTQVEGRKILVHGGGSQASSLSQKLGIHPIKVHGRRATDKQTLDVVVMVFAGLLNKTLVANLQSMKVKAVGICGADAGLIRAVKREVHEFNFGYVGDVSPENTNTSILNQLMDDNMIPVIAPVCADSNGQLLNVNADTVAQVLASALVDEYSVELFYCFERDGVLEKINRNYSLLNKLSFNKYMGLIEQGHITDGMLPKLENAFLARKNGVDKVMILSFRNLNVNIKNLYGTVVC